MSRRKLLKILRGRPEVELKQGKKHLLVKVDGRLVTVLPNGGGGSRDDNDLKASIRALRNVGVRI